MSELSRALNIIKKHFLKVFIPGDNKTISEELYSGADKIAQNGKYFESISVREEVLDPSLSIAQVNLFHTILYWGYFSRDNI